MLTVAEDRSNADKGRGGLPRPVQMPIRGMGGLVRGPLMLPVVVVADDALEPARCKRGVAWLK